MIVTDYTALPYGLLSHETVHDVDVFWYETKQNSWILDLPFIFKA